MRKSLRFISAVRASIAAAILLAAAPTAPAAAAAEILAHHAVSTKSAAAQREFDLGLTLIYAFNPEEATFHFQEAARRDPQLAMAFWGIALAAGRNVNTPYDLQRAAIGRAAIAEARKLPASPIERRYIDALAPRYDALRDDQILAAERRYAAGMDALARATPNDADALALAAESYMDLTPLDMWPGGHPNTYTERVISLLRAALARDPHHVGAHHFLIHTYEDAPDPRPALDSARALAALDLPTGAEHLAHMPAHIFTRVGQFDDAIRASLRAIALFSRYLPNEHSAVHNGYQHHDYQVLGYAYAMSGQWAKARDNATTVAAQVNDTGAAVETYLRFHKWRDLLALPAPSQPGVRYQFARALASANTGDTGPAIALVAAMKSATDARTGIARSQLQAALDLADHRRDAAIEDLRRGVAFQDSLPSKEPPAWYYPVRETLGAQLALTGKFGDARTVFEDDLKRNPNNPRSLFGLATVLEKIDPPRARRVFGDFRQAWSHADVPLRLEDL